MVNPALNPHSPEGVQCPPHGNARHGIARIAALQETTIGEADSEAELQIRLRQSERHLARAIDEALARMRNGTYGICETCNRPISKVRLEAVPWARLCRDCKESEPAA